MKIILDVNAAFNFVINRGFQKQIDKTLSEAHSVLAPDIYIAEATNTAWQYFYIQNRTLEDCQELLVQSVSLVESFIPTLKFHEQALALSCKFQHPAYDCFYLALAQEYVGTLLTFDKKLIKLADQLGIPTITFN